MINEVMKYDLFVQNNASREIYQFLGLSNVSDGKLYIKFEDIDIQGEDGEYTYALIANTRDDVEYELAAMMMDSRAVIDGVEYDFKDLRPLTGLMRIGEPKEQLIYVEDDENNNDWFYKG